MVPDHPCDSEKIKAARRYPASCAIVTRAWVEDSLGKWNRFDEALYQVLDTKGRLATIEEEATTEEEAMHESTTPFFYYEEGGRTLSLMTSKWIKYTGDRAIPGIRCDMTGDYYYDKPLHYGPLVCCRCDGGAGKWLCEDCEDGEQEEATTEEEDGEPCEICRSSAASKGGLPMLLCDGARCGKGFHAVCMGMATAPEESAEPWSCEDCARKAAVAAKAVVAAKAAVAASVRREMMAALFRGADGEQDDDGAPLPVTFSGEVAKQKSRTYYGAFWRGEQSFSVDDCIQGEGWAARITSIWRDAASGEGWVRALPLYRPKDQSQYGAHALLETKHQCNMPIASIHDRLLLVDTEAKRLEILAQWRAQREARGGDEDDDLTPDVECVKVLVAPKANKATKRGRHQCADDLMVQKDEQDSRRDRRQRARAEKKARLQDLV